ncbi:kynurenine/alpha-aminoadipate aminotransferase, mitochondrial-like [Panulirus ornatus]|uniref:kynurenine/alpha-aminoadipate aminotransferase, mitochondrial-like n=1 Tax=Panulirus ornatus TaxID=150431 RepID=UPI003A8A92F0
MDYSRFLNAVARKREPLLIRELFALQQKAPRDVVFLTTGVPNPDTFPIVSGSLQLRDGRTLTLDPGKMEQCLQYGPTPGYPPLLEQLRALTQKLHSPPGWGERELVVTTGSQSGLLMAMEMMLNPGDPVLVEQPCYTGALSIMSPHSPRFLPVEADEYGLRPDSLRAALSPWNPQDIRQATQGVPKFLYTVPTGSNPTGVVATEERRREVYKIAQMYNLIILEDDPYYFLQYHGKSFAPSYLQLDADGRVLRFDSFSKVVAAGLRVGWVTGPKPLIRKLNLHKGAAVISTASMSQVIISELLALWGDEGLDQHTHYLRQYYVAQRDAMLQAANKYLTGVCEWSVPTGGMFLWLKVCGVRDTWTMLLERGLEKRVMLVPGQGFMVDSTKPCQYLRASFSSTTPEEMDKGLCNLAQLIKEETELQKSVPLLKHG